MSLLQRGTDNFFRLALTAAPVGGEQTYVLDSAGTQAIDAVNPVPNAGQPSWDATVHSATIAGLIDGPVSIFVFGAAGGVIHSEILHAQVMTGTLSTLDAPGVRAALGLAAANVDAQLAAIFTDVAPGAIRTAVGLAAANLDTQLAGISTGIGAAAIRAAVGLAAANLDTQLSAASRRAALGLAAANLDAQLAAIGSFSAASIRAALGLAAANLDTQLLGIGNAVNPAVIRGALGLAFANLDAQFAAISAPLTAAQIRAAVGLAAANLDYQFTQIGPSGLASAGIRAALGVQQPNLDEEIGKRNNDLAELLSRLPLPQGASTGSRS